ncbi:hypothetical protein ATKI12_7802 [Kitasatospora sp. Ki12]
MTGRVGGRRVEAVRRCRPPARQRHARPSTGPRPTVDRPSTRCRPVGGPA